MAENRISDYLLMIKQQAVSQEMLFEYLIKVEAMVEVILAKDLTDFSKERMHSYLWVVSDLVSKARLLNEDILDRLVKITPLLLDSDMPMNCRQ